MNIKDLQKTMRKLKELPLLIIPVIAIFIATLAGIFSISNDRRVITENDDVLNRFQDEIPLSIINNRGEQIDITVEVADTADEIQFGLMERNFLDLNRGMLFVFPGSEVRTFWMKNTYIPLDIIFINEAKVIVKIHKNAVPFDESTDKYTSGTNARYALEVNGGFTDNFDISEGNKLFF